MHAWRRAPESSAPGAGKFRAGRRKKFRAGETPAPARSYLVKQQIEDFKRLQAAPARRRRGRGELMPPAAAPAPAPGVPARLTRAEAGGFSRSEEHTT